MFSVEGWLAKCIFTPKNGPVPERPVNGYAASFTFCGVYIQARGVGDIERCDDWADVDDETNGIGSPNVHCSYGAWINNADGGMIHNFQMTRCAHHGLLATRGGTPDMLSLAVLARRFRLVRRRRRSRF